MDKFNYLKEQITAALATWQQTNGGKTTVGWMHAANPEVISALLAELEQANKRAEVESVGADKSAADCVQWMKCSEAADQRIAELEAIATEYAGKFQKAQDAAKHLIIMNDSAQAEIAHLKTLLATPVRLPSPAMFDEDDSAETVISVTRARLRAQGFKVATDGATTVGDE